VATLGCLVAAELLESFLMLNRSTSAR
jgi:hypothetical protein